MRNLFLAVTCALLVSTLAGCAIPLYSADPKRRTQEMMFTSEGLRMLLDEWERTWFLDQPDHTSPYRTHGGII